MKRVSKRLYPAPPDIIRLRRPCPIPVARRVVPSGTLGLVVERVRDGRLMVLFGEALVLVADGSEAYEVVR